MNNLLVYPILFAFISMLLALSVLMIDVELKVPLALLLSALTAGIIYNLIGNTFKNIRKTSIFLTYVNPYQKLYNFREFEKLDYADKDDAQAFYENMRTKRDFTGDGPNTNLDKTEKLLALDFLFGKPGSLNDLINKLCLDPNSRLSKEGIYRVLGEILAASPHNIKKDITKGIEEIRCAENLSTKRIDQLKNVKEVFASSKLASRANEIDKLIS
jgi:hypothetical protein